MHTTPAQWLHTQLSCSKGRGDSALTSMSLFSHQYDADSDTTYHTKLLWELNQKMEIIHSLFSVISKHWLFWWGNKAPKTKALT